MNKSAMEGNQKELLQLFRCRNMIDIQEMVSVLFVLFIICESMMNSILITVFPIKNILGYVMLVIAAAVILFQDIKIDPIVICLVFFCLLLFMISFIKGYSSQSLPYMIQFLSFGLFGILGAQLKVDYSKVFSATVVVSYLFLALERTGRVAFESDFAYGYALIPGALSIMILIVNEVVIADYRKMLFDCILAVPIIGSLLLRSARANYVQLFVFLVLLLFCLLEKKKTAISLLVLGGIIIGNLRNIFWYLYQWTESRGMSVTAVWKTYYLLNTKGQSLLHGRKELFEIVLKELSWKTLLWGNGIGSFESSAGTYTHNLFLSSLVEVGFGGVVFLIILVIRFFIIIRDRETRYTIQNREFILLLFVISFVKLFFSDTYWGNSSFWCLTSYLL